jgi:hypothetical protein
MSSTAAHQTAAAPPTEEEAPEHGPFPIEQLQVRPLRAPISPCSQLVARSLQEPLEFEGLIDDLIRSRGCGVVVYPNFGEYRRGVLGGLPVPVFFIYFLLANSRNV